MSSPAAARLRSRLIEIDRQILSLLAARAPSAAIQRERLAKLEKARRATRQLLLMADAGEAAPAPPPRPPTSR